MNLRDRILATVPQGGVPAKRLYYTLRTALGLDTARIDYALGGLIHDKRIVNSGGRLWQASELTLREAEPVSADPASAEPGEDASTGAVAMRQCRCCRQVLPLTRFGQTRLGRPWSVCLHCHGKNISAGNKRYRETQRYRETLHMTRAQGVNAQVAAQPGTTNAARGAA